MNKQPNMPGNPITTETPLTISAHLGTSEPQEPLPPNVDSFMPHEMDDFNYYDTFEINTESADGSVLFSIDTDNIWKGKYTIFLPSDNLALMKTVHMTTDFVFRFIAVKLPNAPVFLQARVGYTSPYSLGTNYTGEANLFVPNQFIQLDDSSMFDIPLTLPYMGLPQIARVNAATPATPNKIESRLHYTIPSASLRLSMRNKFMPTNMHPEKFQVLVFFKMVNTNLMGNCLDYRYMNYYQRHVDKVGALN
jgi:hypothetical protein